MGGIAGGAGRAPGDGEKTFESLVRGSTLRSAKSRSSFVTSIGEVVVVRPGRTALRETEPIPFVI
jgi:hypothetical protein